MNPGSTARRALIACAILALLVSLPRTAQAGLKVSGGTYTPVSDPFPFYSLTVSLDAGDILEKGDFLTIKNLPGIDFSALTSVPLNAKGKQLWNTTFPEYPTNNTGSLTVNGMTYQVTADSVKFVYQGPTIDNSSSPNSLVLGTFQIFDFDVNLPNLPGGYLITTTYKYSTDGGVNTGSKSVSFTVVPEPSSLAIVALSASCFAGYNVWRRRRSSR